MKYLYGSKPMNIGRYTDTVFVIYESDLHIAPLM